MPEYLTTGLQGEPDIKMVPGSEIPFSVTAVYPDGAFCDVTEQVSVSNTNPATALVADGKLMSLNDGETTLTLTYEKDGEEVKLTFFLTVETFPLDAINPSLFGEGTYDPATHTLVTGQYGFGGWYYATPIDLSGYQTLVVELDEPSACAAQVRLWDEDGYFAPAYVMECGDQTTMRINLHAMQKEMDGNMVDCDPSHIYRVGFWSLGGSSIKLKAVYLQGEHGTVCILTPVSVSSSADVYTLSGVKVSGNGSADRLAPGIYIIGGRKKVVTGR